MLRPSVIHEKAYAKVNLALHIIQRLEDGFHELDSLVAFVDLADELTITPSTDHELHITVDGPFSGDETLATGRNLILQAARLLQRQTGGSTGASFHLRKNIPIGAGLGGGSADAAATLRALNTLWQTNVPDTNLQQIAAQIGADVPACIQSLPVRMQGKGEVLSPLPALPEGAAILLVNAGEPVATAAVYQALQAEAFSGELPQIPQSEAQWWPAATAARNDLQEAAVALSPAISRLEDVLNQQDGQLLTRMSGSGGTCFAVFESISAAETAKAAIQKQFPEYWMQLCQFVNGVDARD